MEAGQAILSKDERKLLSSVEDGERAMREVGTYHLEFAGLIGAYIQENANTLPAAARVRLTKVAIESAIRAVKRTDMPMVALSHLVSLGEMSSDPRTRRWLDELMRADPNWFRPHEISARLFLRQGKFDDALREATRAHQLAPYVESSAALWQQLNAQQGVLSYSVSKSPSLAASG